MEPSPKCKNIFVPGNATELKPGGSRVDVVLWNLFGRDIILEPHTKVGIVSAANKVPLILIFDVLEENVQDNENDESVQCQSAQAESPESELRQTEIDPEEILQKVDLLGTTGWNSTEWQDTYNLICEYACIFSWDDLDLCKTSIVKHSIKLTDPIPFKEHYRCIPPRMYEEVKAHKQEMLDIVAIHPFNSPWASAMVLVRKKDGKLRFCVDLRKLNVQTLKDAYSLPQIDEMLDCLNGTVWFTSSDLKSGYWQVEMEEDCKALTAFTIRSLGFYECDRMAFGLTNALAMFQQSMQSCLGNLHLQNCIIHLDNIIIFSKTPKEHLGRLRAIFEQIKEAGLKLKPLKCECFKWQLTYLGHAVSEKGIQMDCKKVEAIQKWPIPTNITKVCSFLGFTNYYHRFTKKYPQVAKSLYINFWWECGKKAKSN